MTNDDLTRRAIIAAHKAACGPQCDGYPPESDLSHLNGREAAIVELWRADVETCTCTPHPFGDGPQPDCPVHGAIRAHNEAVKRAETAEARIVELLAAVAAMVQRLRDITYASDGGAEYEHTHTGGGEPECPACWVAGIRDALDGTEEATDGTR